MQFLEPTSRHDLAAFHQYRVTFRENAEIVLDLLDAMRHETAMMEDANGVLFLSGVADALRSYVDRTLNSPVVPSLLVLPGGHRSG